MDIIAFNKMVLLPTRQRRCNSGASSIDIIAKATFGLFCMLLNALKVMAKCLVQMQATSYIVNAKATNNY